MSAIFGILRWDGAAASRGALGRMGNTLVHRGPDGRKFVADGTIGLGHCLMRVNQEDLFEAQPLTDREAGLMLVADCRIDNREDLAGALGWTDTECRDRPDSAFVLAAYKRWGEDCAGRLLGDFAFALWDAGAKRLLLARDHMGQRSVFYHLGKDFIAFATEIKALWAVPDVPRVLSEAMIGKSLIGYRGRPLGATLYDGIFGLPGGAVLRLGADGITTMRRYWEPKDDPAHRGQGEAYYIETYRRVLEEAVACRLRRLIRAPALCFSGGFDSGSIAALAGPVLQAQKRKLIALASVAAKGSRGPERDARPAVEICGRHMPHLDVHYVTRGEQPVFADFERQFNITDGPADPNHLHRTLFAVASGAGARLVMDGHGGDYTVNYRGGPVLGRWLLTGQWRRFLRELRAYRRVSGRPYWRILAGELSRSVLPAGVLGFVETAKRGFAPLWSTRPVADDFARELIAKGDVDPVLVRGQPASRPRWRAWCLQVLSLQVQAAAPGLALLAAAQGLDVTRPFHDKRVVELGLSIPEDLYMKDGRDRHLARAALADLLPPEFQTRHGGNDSQDPDYLALARSLAGDALEQLQGLERDAPAARYVDFGKVRRLLAAREAEDSVATRLQITRGLQAVTIARFVAWFDRQNR